MGPSKLLGLPVSLTLMGMGYALLGVVNPLLLIFSLPEMVDVVDYKYPDLDEYSKMQIYDTSSGLFNAILGLGQVMGPVYATTVTEVVGFRECCDYVACASAFLGFLYLIFTKPFK